jgi:hypothetical protein
MDFAMSDPAMVLRRANYHAVQAPGLKLTTPLGVTRRRCGGGGSAGKEGLGEDPADVALLWFSTNWRLR